MPAGVENEVTSCPDINIAEKCNGSFVSVPLESGGGCHRCAWKNDSCEKENETGDKTTTSAQGGSTTNVSCANK